MHLKGLHKHQNKKTGLLILLAILILLIIGVFINKATTQLPDQTNLDVLFQEVYSLQDSRPSIDYGMTADGTSLFSIEGYVLTQFDLEMKPLRTIDLPFHQYQIYRFIQISDKELAVVTMKEQPNYLKPEGLLSHSKEVFIVDFDAGLVKAIDNSSYTILEFTQYDRNQQRLYLKFHEDDLLFYGYLDLNNNTYTIVTQLSESDYFDIYNYEEKLASTTLDNGYYKVFDTHHNLIYSDRIRKTNHFNAAVLHPLKYHIVSNQLVFLDDTVGDFGTIRAYDPSIGALTGFEKKLTQPFFRFKAWDQIAFVVITINESLDFHFSEEIICLKDFSMRENALKTPYFEKVNKLTLLTSINNDAVTYYEKHNQITNLIFENFSTGKQVILTSEAHASLGLEKTAHQIKDDSGRPINFYSYLHDSTKKRATLILLHGGPYSRDYRDTHQEQALILFKLGFNVVELNYHGSEYLGPAYRDYAGTSLPMQAANNVDVLIKWLEINTAYDQNNTVLMGSSYGGYLTMFIRQVLSDKITHAVALAPAPVENLIQANDQEHLDVLNNPDQYDIEILLSKNPQPIGLVYNYLDPQMSVKKDWKVVSRRHPSLHIIDQFTEGHFVPVSSFKKVVDYLLEVVDNPEVGL